MTRNLTEQEQLDEALFGGVGVALLAKLFMILTQRDNIEKVLSALRTRAKELPPEVVTLIDATQNGLNIIEESLPPAVDSLTDKTGKWAPSNWATNIFVDILSKVIKKDKAEDGESAEAGADGGAAIAEQRILNKIRKLVTEELEVVLTNEEAAEIFDLDPGALIYEVMAEAWEGDSEIDPTGEYADKTSDELCAMKKKLMDKESRTEDEQKKVRQINFAIRSKQKGPKFGKVDC